jgi:hypothetical protein
MELQRTIHLPLLHPKQAEIKDSLAKRKVLATGRRFGKTTLVADMATDEALKGRRVLYAAPKQSQTEAFWGYCSQWLLPLMPEAMYKNESNRLIELNTGGVIRAKTAFDADTLRGDYADLLILDEYSYMDPDVWDLVGQPMLVDNDGDAIFIFSPARKNHAYHMFLRAEQEQRDGNSRWACWHGTSFDNPHLSLEALAELSTDMTEEAYKQEILAEFLELEGAVFRNIGPNLYTPDATHAGYKLHRIVAGLDWGRQNDATVLSIGCADCCKELALHRLTKIDYPTQRAHIKDWLSAWGNPDLLGEANSIGLPNIEQLRVDGVRCAPFDTTLESKSKIIVNMQLALERETWKWVDNKVATSEFEAYEMKPTRTGQASYAAPEGLHDDCVMARCIMLWRATHPGAHSVA